MHWFPWCEEAFEAARRQEKPVFLSIGYSACHWCHVMERESFEDEETARYLNDHFISIKVDREERPDIDSIYMDSVQAMSGHGGWPMSVFLLPNGKPFFGGTYFPPVDRPGMPSFGRVLAGVIEAFQKRRTDLESRAGDLVNQIARSLPIDSSRSLDASIPDHAVYLLEKSFDSLHGGFGAAPKFPQPMTLDFLLRQSVPQGGEKALHMAELTLEKMACGGIFDHLGGGFHRYSTDPYWLVPHFEKMLYDNALLARLYLHAWQRTGKALYHSVMRETLGYVTREMTHPDGGFYSSQDADSEGVEGKYFVWSAEEIRELLGSEDGELFSRAYGVSVEGNFEGSNILNRPRDWRELASEGGLSEQALEEKMAAARQRLFRVRTNRIAPERDDKIITSWNGLMLAAFADAARVTGLKKYRDTAIRNGLFLETEIEREGRLSHTWKDGRRGQTGFLEDYANVADGMLALYRATFDERWFRVARRLADTILERFFDRKDGAFFDTPDDHEALIVRPKARADNASPSGNAMAVRLLLEMAAYTGENGYREPAEEAIASMGALMAAHPNAFGHWLGALVQLVSSPVEVAIAGRPDDERTRALLSTLNSAYRPHILTALIDPESAHQETTIPLLEGRVPIDGKPAAYVCTHFRCREPMTDPASLEELLDRTD